MIADIFITTKDRPRLLRRSLQSLWKDSSERQHYRLTVVQDGVNVEVRETLDEFSSIIDYVIYHNVNMGLGPSMNEALAHIDALKRWDGDKAPPLTCYVQDDVLYTKGWLEKLSQKYMQLKGPLRLGFASGHDATEHPVKKDLGNGMLLKDWIRATNLMATHEYWMSMWPISRIDPETGRERGRPHDGLGSSVDWWFIRNHPNSVCRSGRTNLVIPGLLQHAGYRDSTWLKRELPESEADKKVIGDDA